MSDGDRLATLRQRAAYLANRIEAKRATEYDRRERDALLWAIERLSPPETPKDRAGRAQPPPATQHHQKPIPRASRAILRARCAMPEGA